MGNTWMLLYILTVLLVMASFFSGLEMLSILIKIRDRNSHSRNYRASQFNMALISCRHLMVQFVLVSTISHRTSGSLNRTQNEKKELVEDSSHLLPARGRYRNSYLSMDMN
jgi:hypothetical protein